MRNVGLKTVLFAALALISTSSFASSSNDSWEIVNGKVHTVDLNGTKTESTAGMTRTTAKASWEIVDGKVYTVSVNGSKTEATDGICRTR